MSQENEEKVSMDTQLVKLVLGTKFGITNDVCILILFDTSVWKSRRPVLTRRAIMSRTSVSAC